MNKKKIITQTRLKLFRQLPYSIDPFNFYMLNIYVYTKSTHMCILYPDLASA